MSYDIELIDQKTGKVATMDNAVFVKGGTIPVELDMETGQLVPSKQREACINITYNYGEYYRSVTEDDAYFPFDRNEGIRCVYGMTGEESIPYLKRMIKGIEARNKDFDGNWIKSKRRKIHYYDESGNETKPYGNNIYTTEIEEYYVCEGDTSNYWEPTAANAITPLKDMIHMAIECPDAVWDGD